MVVVLANQSKLGHEEGKKKSMCMRLQHKEQATLFSKGFSFQAAVVGVFYIKHSFYIGNEHTLPCCMYILLITLKHCFSFLFCFIVFAVHRKEIWIK